MSRNPSSRSGRSAIITEKAGRSFHVAAAGSAYLQLLQQMFPNDEEGKQLVFSDLDTAIAWATASQGDKIYVYPGYTGSLTTAGAIALDVAGTSIIGLGVGNNRPVLTFASTDNSATMTISGNNCALKNVVLVCNDDGLTNALVVSGDNCDIDIEFQDTSAAVETATAVRLDTANNVKLKLKYNGFTAGNAVVSAVRIDDCDNVKIDIDAYGVVSTAWVEMVDVASTNVSVRGRMYTQGITNFSRDVVDTITGSTWDAVIFDASAGAQVSGGSAAALAVDDVTAIASDVTTIKNNVGGVDSATNVLGADDADNQFASTNVVSNRDGSILERTEAILNALVDDDVTNLIGFNDSNNNGETGNVVANRDGTIVERLEALMDPLAGYSPKLGFAVTKVSNLADGAGTDNLFTVTGRVLITSLTGEVTTVIGGAATLKIRDTTNSIDLCAATTIDTDAVGTMYALTSISANILNGTGATPVVGSIPNITGAQQIDVAIVGDAQAPLTLAQVLDAADTGNITWVLTYIPLTSGATVAAAA